MLSFVVSCPLAVLSIIQETADVDLEVRISAAGEWSLPQPFLPMTPSKPTKTPGAAADNALILSEDEVIELSDSDDGERGGEGEGKGLGEVKGQRDREEGSTELGKRGGGMEKGVVGGGGQKGKKKKTCGCGYCGKGRRRRRRKGRCGRPASRSRSQLGNVEDRRTEKGVETECNELENAPQGILVLRRSEPGVSPRCRASGR